MPVQPPLIVRVSEPAVPQLTVRLLPDKPSPLQVWLRRAGKRNELHTFAVIPKRWVVERTISWLEKCRRLWKNCERKLLTSLAMMRLAFISLLLKRY